MEIQLPMQPSSQRMTFACTCNYKRSHVCASVNRLFFNSPKIYFQPIKVSVQRASKDEVSNQIDSEAFKLHHNKPKIPSMTELFQESGNGLPLFQETFCAMTYPNQKTNSFHKEYTSENSMSTIVSSSIWPSKYIRIKYKRQRTRYISLHVFS